MTSRLALVGGGGFGREILDIVDALNASGNAGDRFEVVGVFDDGRPDPSLLEAYEVRHEGPVAAVLDLPPDVRVVVGIAHPATRRRVVAQLGDRERPSLVHPSATHGRRVEIGRGAVICSHVSIANHVRIGDDAQVGANSTVGHDTTLEACVTVSPMVALSGNVVLEAGAFMGTGASINQGLRVGTDAIVGSGAAVIRDVRAGDTVVGNPARSRS